MKTKLSLILAAVLPSCSNLETHSGPFVNESALRQMGDHLSRTSEYERRGYSPGDAREMARFDNFGGPFGPMSGGSTPIAGYGWGIGSSSSR